MKIRNILQNLPQDALEILARKRLSQVADIRLPQSVLIDELSEALTSYAYVSNSITIRHPPSFSIIHLLINIHEYSLPSEHFYARVIDETNRMISLASRRPIFPKPKNYDLYLKMLSAAWEYDSDINPSEANMLKVLRDELGISLMEHFVIEHHPDLHRNWRIDAAYEIERNHLRNAGILYAHEDQYVIPEEIVLLIRRVWGYELSIPQFKRLFDVLNNDQLKKILDKEGLGVSGTSQEKKDRILENYVLPHSALDILSIEEIRNAARNLSCKSSGSKEELVDRILDWLDCDEDVKAKDRQDAGIPSDEPMEREKRELTSDAFTDLLRRLTNEALYDVLARLTNLKKSGSKEQRIKTLLESPFNEKSILSKLVNESLYELCKQIGLSPGGVKDEKISRVIDAYRNYLPPAIGKNIGSPFGNKPEKLVGDLSPIIPNESQLPRLPSVKAEFSYLNDAEQIILSFILDYKSLSDPELDKLIQRFALPWFLPKAQMTEMIDKLKSNGKDLIKIRSLGDHNIYEVVS